MHFSALSSILLLALSTKSAADAPPKGYSAYFSIFNHIGCDIQSLGVTTVQESQVGECLTFSYPAISASLDSIQEGCALTFYPYNDCRGKPNPLSDGIKETGCFNSNVVLSSVKINC